MADYFYVQSETRMNRGEPTEALSTINKAITYNPNEPTYYRQRAKIYIASTVYTEPQSQGVLKTLALADLTTALDLNPQNLATIRNTAPLYFFLANRDLTQATSLENTDSEYLPIAQEYYKAMQNYVPKDVGVQVLAAKYQKRLSLMEDYESSLENIKSLRPDLIQWHPDLIQ